jgi:RNA polymerase sigma-70 factor, ECF subfamily
MGLQPNIAVETLLADRSKLLAYIWSIIRDFHATEDIFQEVIVSAMLHAEEINDVEHLLSWARQTARFRGIDWLRRRKQHPLPLDEDVMNLLESHWTRLDAVPSQIWTDAIYDCVRKLTDYARQLITLRYVDGLTGLEVAKQVGRTPRTVYVALSRAYRQLEDCLKGQVANQPGARS